MADGEKTPRTRPARGFGAKRITKDAETPAEGSAFSRRAFSFAPETLHAAARRYVLRVCTRGAAKEARARLAREADAVCERLFPPGGEEPAARASTAFFADARLRGRALDIGGERLTCAAFERLPEADVAGAFAYVVAAAGTDAKDGEAKDGGTNAAGRTRLTDAYLRNMWADAYVCAALAALRGTLAAGGARPSVGFAPGVGGMPLAEMTKLARILDFSAAGAATDARGILSPAKALAGVFPVARAGAALPDVPSCADCVGDRRGCDCCAARFFAPGAFSVE